MLSNKNSAIKGQAAMLQKLFCQMKLFLSIIQKNTNICLVGVLFANKLEIHNYLIMIKNKKVIPPVCDVINSSSAFHQLAKK